MKDTSQRANRNLLLIEDAKLSALAEKQQLEMLGYRVILADSGEPALEIIRAGEASIDLILMDIELGKGLDVTTVARDILKLRELPIVFLAAHTEADIVARTRDVSCYGYVIRNSGMHVLDASIRMAFRLFEVMRQSHQSETYLHEANAYNRSLLEASLDPLVTIGHDGRITDVNATTETATGYSRHQLIGTDFADYFTDPDRARDGYHVVFRDGQIRDYRLELRNRDGTSRTVLYNASLYRNASGQVIGIFAAARDITERQRAEDHVRELLSEKETILKEVHHRIKNNLATVIALLSLQAGNSSRPKTARAWRRATTSNPSWPRSPRSSPNAKASA